MAFTGISTTALDFYEDLENDNSKSFWTANKQVYDDAVRAPLEALTSELGKEFGAAKLFRPYRDVRFSADKTPYKTHQGAWFGEASVYFHISAAGLFIAAGYWQTSSEQVGRYRRAVADDVAGPELERVLATISKKYEVGGDQLVRVPPGFDKDHARAQLLRYKTLTASKEVGVPAWLTTPSARAEIAKLWRGLAPLTSWLDTHVGRD